MVREEAHKTFRVAIMSAVLGGSLIISSGSIESIYNNATSEPATKQRILKDKCETKIDLLKEEHESALKILNEELKSAENLCDSKTKLAITTCEQDFSSLKGRIFDAVCDSDSTLCDRKDVVEASE